MELSALQLLQLFGKGLDNRMSQHVEAVLTLSVKCSELVRYVTTTSAVNCLCVAVPCSVVDLTSAQRGAVVRRIGQIGRGQAVRTNNTGMMLRRFKFRGVMLCVSMGFCCCWLLLILISKRVTAVSQLSSTSSAVLESSCGFVPSSLQLYSNSNAATA